jgi:hypothetical protein
MALDLTTEAAEPELVKWEGAEYPLGDSTELSAGELVLLEQAIARVSVLADDDARRGMTRDEATRLDEDMRWLIGLALPTAPEDALDRLARKLDKAMLLISAFAAGSSEPDTTTPAPSSSSSPESNASTGATPASGPA